jgi:hypothetical protein
MSAAFLDSSVLADATLKDTGTRKRTKTFLQSFSEKAAPQYALKELSAGPIGAYIWLHNVLAEEQSYDKALGRLHRRSRTPARNQTSSAIEALRAAEQSLMARMRRGLYPTSEADRAEHLRLALKRLIQAGWLGGMSIPDRILFPLRCHTLRPPVERTDGLIEQFAHRCVGPHVCDQATHLKKESDSLDRVCSFLESKEKSPEDERRLEALTMVRSGQPINDSQCRSLGDAVFAILSPPGHVIVTTNVKDHQPLAAILGKKVVRPTDAPRG